MADINELAERLEKLEDAFNRHLQEDAVRGAHIEMLTNALTRVDHTVHGNGKDGLNTITARMDERLIAVTESVNELPEIIRAQVDAAISTAITQLEAKHAEEEKKEEKKLSPADSALKWFTDKILPYFVTGLFIILLQALWELVKIKLATP